MEAAGLQPGDHTPTQERIMCEAYPSQAARTTALLVIDVQQGLFGRSTPIYKAGDFLANINALVDRAHEAGAPVIFVKHSDPRILPYGTPAWELHPALHLEEGDVVVEKTHGNAFEETPLDRELRDRGATAVVVTGLVTHGCVLATSVGARACGYGVTLASDGHSSFSKDAAAKIAEWNAKLAATGMGVKPAAEIAFG
jgi:nicotinamidase-related amidase